MKTPSRIRLGCLILAAFLLLPLFANAQSIPATFPNLSIQVASKVTAITAQSDGNIYIAGRFTLVNGVPRNLIARLNPNGSVDQTWIGDRPEFVTTGDTHDLLLHAGRLLVATGYGMYALDLANGSSEHLTSAFYESINTLAGDGTNAYFGGELQFPPLDIGGLVGKLNSTNGGSGEIFADGAVTCVFVDGTNLYVGGDFGTIGYQPRAGLARISTSPFGTVDPNWNPGVSGRVLALARAGEHLCIGGAFTNCGGHAVTNLARVSVTGTGVVDTNWNPNPNGRVESILADGTNIFVAGGFGAIGGLPRTNLAKINSDGSVDPAWKATPKVLEGGLRLARDGYGILVAGSFTRISGNVNQQCVARLNPIGGEVDKSFAAQAGTIGSIRDMAKQVDGKIVLAGDFTSVGGVAREYLARLNADFTVDIGWDPQPDSTVHAVATSQTHVYAGGAFSSIGGTNRHWLAKLNIPGQGTADPIWDPHPSAGGSDFNAGGVLDLEVIGSNLFVLGNFDRVSGQNCAGLAKLDATGTGAADLSFGAPVGSAATAIQAGPSSLFILGTSGASKYIVNATSTNWHFDPAWQGPINASLVCMALQGTNLFFGGAFTSLDGLSRPGIAKVRSEGLGGVDPVWNPSALPLAVPAATALGLENANVFSAFADSFPGNSQNMIVARIGAAAAGAVDHVWSVANQNRDVEPSLLGCRSGAIFGGPISSVGGAPRIGLAYLAVAEAPVMIRQSATSLMLLRNPANGPEVTHYRITGITGGKLFKSDGTNQITRGGFIRAEEGAAGLVFVGAANGRVEAVSALNDTPEGAGGASTTTDFSAPQVPVFAFSKASYSIREGQGSLIVTVRKYGNGPATVDYATSDETATGGRDYQTRSGTLNFSAAQTLKNIILAIADDLETEGDEQFSILLTNASSTAFIAGPNSTRVTIVDNDIVGLADSVTTNTAPSPLSAATAVLEVSLQPSAAHGQWRLLGELNWHEGGAAIGGLVRGNYEIEFRPVNGYQRPAVNPVTVPVDTGATNVFVFFYAVTTNLNTGNLSVIIQPNEVAAAGALTNRGQWLAQGVLTNWLNSGDIVPNLNAGSYTVVFKAVAGRSTPLPQLIQVGGADAIYSGVGTYFFASSSTAATPSVVPFGPATTNAPYRCNGQLQTSVGFGSGFVVKPRVVLTAAHVLFDDFLLSYTTYARWFFQRYRDRLEPVPQVPRGWYVFEGYAAQRQSDRSPGLSTAESQNLDAAALYFLEDAGRGGYGGYLASDAVDNEFFLGANNKFLAGYPLDGVLDADKGKLFATTATNLDFSRAHDQVYATTQIASYPGNSGGPLYIQNEDGVYYPAGICLGGTGQLLIRAINGEVVDLINRAEISANGGGNIVGGGVTLLSPGLTAPPFGTGLLTVNLTPSNLTGVRVGWRVEGNSDTNYFTDSLTTVGLIGGGGYPIEFKAVPGFVTPGKRTVQITVGQVVTLQVDYVPIRPQLNLGRTTGLTLSGDVGAQYRVESASNLVPPVVWSPLLTLRLVNSSGTISNTLPTSTGSRFYRAVLVP